MLPTETDQREASPPAVPCGFAAAMRFCRPFEDEAECLEDVPDTSWEDEVDAGAVAALAGVER